MITKVGVENEPSRKAVTKAGFRELGVMRLVKAGPRKQTTIDLSGARASARTWPPGSAPSRAGARPQAPAHQVGRVDAGCPPG